LSEPEKGERSAVACSWVSPYIRDALSALPGYLTPEQPGIPTLAAPWSEGSPATGSAAAQSERRAAVPVPGKSRCSPGSPVST